MAFTCCSSSILTCKLVGLKGLVLDDGGFTTFLPVVDNLSLRLFGPENSEESNSPDPSIKEELCASIMGIDPGCCFGSSIGINPSEGFVEGKSLLIIWASFKTALSFLTSGWIFVGTFKLEDTEYLGWAETGESVNSKKL